MTEQREGIGGVSGTSFATGWQNPDAEVHRSSTPMRRVRRPARTWRGSQIGHRSICCEIGGLVSRGSVSHLWGDSIEDGALRAGIHVRVSTLDQHAAN
jgi:hypothetical protein